ncbi:MAG: hypothetical protein IJJ50_05315 [Lachnospiraceae bacterium]|nr:hypothetical protein [Lachnospiraceae bacterium]
MERWRPATKEEAEQIKQSAYLQYRKVLAATLKTIGMITLVLLVAGAVVQLAVRLITGYNPHFYGFITYYIAIALGMGMVAYTNFEQERRMYRLYRGIRYTVANGTCLSRHEEKAAFHYSLNTGVRYSKKYFAGILLEDGTETEADIPYHIYTEIRPGAKLLCLHSDNAQEEDEVNLVHLL